MLVYLAAGVSRRWCISPRWKSGPLGPCFGIE